MSNMDEQQRQRWRLILGRFAEPSLGGLNTQSGQRLDASLEFLYGREYAGRGVRGTGPEQAGEKGPGSLDPSQLQVPHWLSEVRRLFPKETVEILERDALQRYGLNELLTDAQTLSRLEPNHDLLRTLLTLRGQLRGEVLTVARGIVRHVSEELRRQLRSEMEPILCGRRTRQRSALGRDFDALGTLRRNLHLYDPEQRRVMVEKLLFFSRQRRRLPWTVILCVDQSGSMTDALIHSAIMAGILTALPALKVKLVVFDTQIVDLSEHLDDPLSTLLSVQLGGGTDIGKALRYCEQLIEQPARTVLLLVSDFCEGASVPVMLGTVKRLAEAHVTLLGLAALDEQAVPSYDRSMAQRLTDLGMPCAALTPRRLAEWLLARLS